MVMAFVENMHDGQIGIAPDHPGTSIAHHLPDFLTLGRLEAMNCAIRANRFEGSKRAYLILTPGVIQ
jgi:hypothetical protein